MNSGVAQVIITREKWKELSERLSVAMLSNPKDPVTQAMSKILNGVRNGEEVVLQ